MRIKKSGYNLENNIKEVSEDKEHFDEAKKEWVFLGIVERNAQDGRCACNRKIKNEYIMFNTKNGKIITTGSSCCEKICTIKSNSKSIKILQKILQKNLYISSYETIEDMEEFCKKCQENLKKYFEEKYKNSISCKDNLNELLEELTINGNILFQELYDDIKTKIEELEEADCIAEEDRQQRMAVQREALQRRAVPGLQHVLVALGISSKKENWNLR